MQGYVTLAIGRRGYLEQAVNLALSLRLNDPTRPICLITDQPMALTASARRRFDVVRRVQTQPGYHGCPSKLLVQANSPFDESMFIDADCLLVKTDMDRHWSKLSQAPVGIAGEVRRAGRWRGIDIQQTCAALGLDFMVVMNSGLFYFRNEPASAAVFQTAQALVASERGRLGMLQRGAFQLADEPFLGAALGKHKIQPVGYAPEEGSVMVTTVRATGINADPFTGRSAITKHADFALMNRFVARRRVRHSPSVAHFVKLRPLKLYQRLSDSLRARFGVERFDFDQRLTTRQALDALILALRSEGPLAPCRGQARAASSLFR